MALPIRLRTIAAASVVIASGLIIFYAYQSIIGSTDGGMQALPIIHADSDPFRIAPETPGGAEIPNQGSSLFNVLDKNNADGLALNGIQLEAEPKTIFENPAAANQNTAGFDMPVVPDTRTESLFGMIDDLESDTSDAIIVRDLKADDEPQESVDVVVEAEPVTAIEITQAPIKEVESEEKTNVVITPTRKPSAPVQKEAANTFSLDRVLASEPTQKRYYIQLASLRGEDAARTAYGNIRDGFPKLVEGTSVFFPTADLGARGTFTRIQIGPLDQAEAKSRCADYTASARGGTCLVISR